MGQARELVQERRVGTLEQAFKLLADGAGELAPQRATTPDALMHELVTIRRMLEHVLADNAALREQLAAPKDETSAPQEDTERMRKRLAYLEGELKRRDEQPQEKRPWWKVWEKRS